MRQDVKVKQMPESVMGLSQRMLEIIRKDEQRIAELMSVTSEGLCRFSVPLPLSA